ncbi:MAG: DUF2911 domain-containing protein [Chitinophagaceae bacterium]|nr:MAG: DUF2911 domain-containing protein [Chitinophagaceae bacterium]
MKKLTLVVALALFAIAANAQTAAVKFPVLDASPLDVAYYPANAAKVKKDDASMPIIKVVYSRPAKKGREVFGVLEQFDKVWRLGANESTEVYFDRAVTIGDQKIKPGRYSLFAIPSKDKWTIIVNKQTDRWGAFSYDEKKDVARVNVPVTKLDKAIESFSIVFIEAPDGANMVMAWDTTQVTLPIGFKK